LKQTRKEKKRGEERRGEERRGEEKEKRREEKRREEKRREEKRREEKRREEKRILGVNHGVHLTSSVLLETASSGDPQTSHPDSSALPDQDQSFIYI
jgi:hypothetical protein